MTEQWRPVVGYEGRYEVSDMGRVASLPKVTRRSRIIMRQNVTDSGYFFLRLCTDGHHVNHCVHTLVIEAFHGPRPDGMVARHLDGDPTNNHPTNLRWGTSAENAADMLAHGRNRNARKTECLNGHPFSPKNTRIEADGARKCRPCRADRERTRRATQRTERTSR